METCEQPSLGSLVANTAILLSMISRDASALQHHLAGFIGSLPPAAARQLDPVTLQSLDQLTQMLEDLETVFRAASAGSVGGSNVDWNAIIADVKLERVRAALTQGGEDAGGTSPVEIF